MGRVAVITGASTGIGRSLAERLADVGDGEPWSLVLVARSKPRLDELAAELNSRHVELECVVHPCDVGEVEQVRRLTTAVGERFGRIDALVCNAGIAPLVPLAETGPDVVQQCLDVNLRAVLAGVQFAWPLLAEAGKRGGMPIVLATSSMATADPFPGFFAYAASKAGVNLAMHSVAKEGVEAGIRGMAIAPGAVETGMLRAIVDTDVVPASACLAPDDVARLFVDCIGGRHDKHNGRTLYILRGDAGSVDMTPAGG